MKNSTHLCTSNTSKMPPEEAQASDHGFRELSILMKDSHNLTLLKLIKYEFLIRKRKNMLEYQFYHEKGLINSRKPSLMGIIIFLWHISQILRLLILSKFDIGLIYIER